MTSTDVTLLDSALILLPFVCWLGGALIVAMLLAPIVAGLMAWWYGDDVKEAMRLFVHIEIYPLPGMDERASANDTQRQPNHRSAS